MRLQESVRICSLRYVALLWALSTPHILFGHLIGSRVWLVFVKRAHYRFDFQNWSSNTEVIIGESEESLSHDILHRPSRFHSLLDLE